MEGLGSAGAGADRSGAGSLSKPAAVDTRPRCPDARAGLAFYRARYNDHREDRGARTTWPVGRKPLNCSDAKHLANVWRVKAKVALKEYVAWTQDEWNYRAWLPKLWYAIGMCETALDWHFDSGTYVSAFGIIRSAFPGWNGNNSPREQYRVALGIANRYGLGAWGCYSHGGYRYHLR